jgi:hypothetical protein
MDTGKSSAGDVSMADESHMVATVVHHAFVEEMSKVIPGCEIGTVHGSTFRVWTPGGCQYLIKVFYQGGKEE